jgi:hypothetical protein
MPVPIFLFTQRFLDTLDAIKETWECLRARFGRPPKRASKGTGHIFALRGL